MTQACMGGWCRKREQCPHYAVRVGEPAERLCVKGQDGVLAAPVLPDVRPEAEMVELQFPRIHPRAVFPDWRATA